MERLEKHEVVVLGDGMAAHRFVDQLVEVDKDQRFNITIVKDAPRSSCDWLHAPVTDNKSLSGPVEQPDTHALRIDRENRTVITAQGEHIAYHYLVVATGSSPLSPDIEGAELDGVFYYGSDKDLAAIKRYASTSSKATVLGGGLLSLQAAKACVAMGLDTTLLEYDENLMPRQLSGSADVLNTYIESLGITVRTDARAKCFAGRERVSCVRLIGDSLLPTDLVILAADIRPNDRLARAAGLPTAVGGGIIVDSHLRTADPNIFAIGECASFNGLVCGLVSPGFSMATVLAQNLCGPKRPFNAPDIVTKLRQLGIDPDRVQASSATRPTRKMRVIRSFPTAPTAH